MAKTVLLRGNIVENVVVLAPGTPYDPDPGVVMLTVASDTFVGPGMLLVEGSVPPAFEAAPASTGENLPTNIADAIEAVEIAQQQVSAAVENLKNLQG